MYDRNVGDQQLTFGVSGLLWHQSLVMYDRPTGSFWSHLLGESISGPLKGQKLKPIPSIMTDWKTWRDLHPDGTVMIGVRTTQGYSREFYASLDLFVLGIANEQQAKSWSFKDLQQTPVINDTWQGRGIVVVFDEASVTARMFVREIKGKHDSPLTFNFQAGKLIDQETGSEWHPVAGRAIAGKLKGHTLEAVPAIVSMVDAWKKFHPVDGNKAHLVAPDIAPLDVNDLRDADRKPPATKSRD